MKIYPCCRPAVQGEQFAAEVVARALARDEETVIQRLSGSLKRQHRLVQAVSLDRLASTGQRLSQFRFRHVLIQRGAYAGLDAVECTKLHEATGRALEAMYAAEEERPQSLALARHYEAAGLHLEAARALYKAVRQAMRLSAFREALKQFDHGRARVRGGWTLAQGDMCRVPLVSGWADIVTVGWAIGHFTRWYADDWPVPAGRVLRELHRLAAPNGVIVIIETVGTGRRTPGPPTPRLAAYYTWLEQEWGFAGQVISCDLAFSSVDEAAALTGFFFGTDMADRVRANRWARLPGWAGLWSKRV